MLVPFVRPPWGLLCLAVPGLLPWPLEGELCHMASLSLSHCDVTSGQLSRVRLGSLFRFLLPSPGDNKGQAQGEPMSRHFREALAQCARGS